MWLGITILLLFSFMIQMAILTAMAGDKDIHLSTKAKILFLVPGVGLICMVIFGLIVGVYEGIKDIFKEELKKKK